MFAVLEMILENASLCYFVYSIDICVGHQNPVKWIAICGIHCSSIGWDIWNFSIRSFKMNSLRKTAAILENVAR
jgi:hypothetical protein